MRTSLNPLDLLNKGNEKFINKLKLFITKRYQLQILDHL